MVTDFGGKGQGKDNKDRVGTSYEPKYDHITRHAGGARKAYLLKSYEVSTLR